MRKLLAYIFWPTLAGLVFAVTLLQAPRLIRLVPGLAAYSSGPADPSAPTASFLSFNSAIRKSAPSVVSINYKETIDAVLGQRTPRGIIPFAKIQDDSNSLGSGVIIREDGYIITSYHVVLTDNKISGNDITATLQDGRVMPARIVALDEENDLALLKVDAEQLPALRLADTARLQSGDVVLAIGNPRNVGQSVSMGIISALWERDDSFVIQTDAAINPGNSGGALVNIDGDLIGINSTIISESGGSEGIGFSTPANMALRLLEDFLASGPNGYLGVSARGLAPSEALPRFGKELQGIEIEEVVANGPAEKAGLRAGDVITGVDDHKLVISISNSDTLEELEEARAEARAAIATITDRPAGELVVLDVFREGTFIQVPVILGVGIPQIFDSIEEVYVEPGSEDEAARIPRPASQIN